MRQLVLGTVATMLAIIAFASHASAQQAPTTASSSSINPLLRPFIMRTDGSSVSDQVSKPSVNSLPRNPSPVAQVSHLQKQAAPRARPIAKTQSKPAEQGIPWLMRPFYAANDDPRDGSRATITKQGSSFSRSQWTSQAVAEAPAFWSSTLSSPWNQRNDDVVPSNARRYATVSYEEDNPLTAGGSKEKPKNLSGDQTIGEEPVDNSLQFLRFDTVLLEPGELQVDFGLFYSIAEDIFPFVTDDSEIVHGRIKRRELVAPLEFRYGLARRVQSYLYIPFGWANNEFAITGEDEFENSGGIGDVRAGVTMLLREGNEDCGDITATVGFTAPTGGDPFTQNPVLLAPSALGEGFWAINADLLFINQYDPLVLFYGFGAEWSFAEEYYGLQFQPGVELNYRMGLGFAVNESVTLSTSFSGGYITELEVDNERVAGTILEPLSIRMAATIGQECGIVEPFVDFGLTSDSTTATFGIIWTR